ncbi:sensor histidine kinase [Spirosoma sp. KNUC1025]|uniref:sensor histidine kinase n=1 Tax=Spirosoma sp. KNUC1025 TaxID=2894082 RepID=UPI003862E3A5|nr:histidine kinase [Spirosoma sp. KNUC1025]
MNTFNDRKLRIVGPLILFLIGVVFFRLNWLLELPTSTLLRSELIAISSGYFCWNLTRWVIHRLQKQYPGLARTRRRLIWMTLLLPVLINIGWLVRQLGHMAFNGERNFWPTLSDYTYSLGIQIFFHIIYFVIYEGVYVMRAWQQTYERNERLKKDRLQYQLDTLKSQINPHFLFNSLNSLSSLIYENPQQAEEVVDEISSVYRYLLRANDSESVTLQDELRFIQSYFHLLKTRYGKSLDLQVRVDEAQLDRKLPTLTLQLLLENAVKHNIMMPEQPLQVVIESHGNTLVVRNNLQRKKTPVLSNRVGLTNIAAKYRLLGKDNLSIQERDGEFIVSLPLLENHHTVPIRS